jgi:hypothetical protein
MTFFPIFGSFFSFYANIKFGTVRTHKCINPLRSNDLERIRAVSPLKINIPGKKNLGRQLCTEGFNFGVKGLNYCELAQCKLYFA